MKYNWRNSATTNKLIKSSTNIKRTKVLARKCSTKSCFEKFPKNDKKWSVMESFFKPRTLWETLSITAASYDSCNFFPGKTFYRTLVKAYQCKTEWKLSHCDSKTGKYFYCIIYVVLLFLLLFHRKRKVYLLIRPSLSIADMLYSRRLVTAETFLQNWPEPLDQSSGQIYFFIADTYFLWIIKINHYSIFRCFYLIYVSTFTFSELSHFSKAFSRQVATLESL